MKISPKILIAEDETAIRENIERLLRIEGYEVLTAENGRIALAMAKAHLPALVISDVMMPEMDGHQLLEALRSDPLTAATPLIFLTARADRVDMRTGMNLGADDYLTKPFQRDELLRAIRARIERRASEEQMHQHLRTQAHRLMTHDAVTGLPNRNQMTERLEAAVNMVQRNNLSLALILLNIEGISRVLDSLGHDAADHILRLVAERLLGRVNDAMFAGAHDTVGRMADTRFAVLLAGYADAAYLDAFSTELIEAVSQPYALEGQDMFISATAGIAVYPSDTGTPDAILRHAEVALGHALNEGTGTIRYFSGEMNERAVRRLRLHNELHRAIERQELSLHYQPQVAIPGGGISGFEALMRWRHNELGFVSPAEFIPLAEENGLIVEFGAWALDVACRQAKSWLNAGLNVPRVAVNLSARQFIEGNLVDTVRKALTASGLPPERLELEITESIAMQGVDRTLAMLHELKSLGVKLAMDDFGTGYSSLAYLKRFPLDILKVDQSFVRNAISDHGDAAIVRTVVAMAHSFGMKVIAEGVETEAHLTFLSGLGCEYYQGYLFSKPLPAQDVARLLSGESSS
jgi:diguanylate cyclase (GGDEF)-like protein